MNPRGVAYFVAGILLVLILSKVSDRIRSRDEINKGGEENHQRAQMIGIQKAVAPAYWSSSQHLRHQTDRRQERTRRRDQVYELDGPPRTHHGRDRAGQKWDQQQNQNRHRRRQPRNRLSRLTSIESKVSRIR